EFGIRKELYRGEDVVHPSGVPVGVRLPAALLRGREFVVDARLEPADGERVVQFRITTAGLPNNAPWDGKGPLVGSAAARDRLLKGLADFRAVFPQVICFPQII